MKMSMKKIRKPGLLLFIATLLIAAGCGNQNREAAAEASPLPSTSPPAATVTPPVSPSTAASLPAAPVPSAAAPQTEYSLVPQHVGFMDSAAGWLSSEEKAGDVLWQTGDGGTSWNRVLFTGMDLQELYPFGADRGFVIAQSDCKVEQGVRSCAKAGIYGTSDGKTWSARWEQAMKGLDPYTDAGRLWFADSQTGYALVNTLLLKTGDGGGSWQPVSVGQPGEPFAPEQMAFTDKNKGWVLGRAGAACQGLQGTLKNEGNSACAAVVMHTTDGGGSWQTQALPEGANGRISRGISFPDAASGRLLLFQPDDLQAQLYATEDGGGTWTLRTEMRGGRPYARTVQFVTADKGFIPLDMGAGPIEGGLLVTTDGGRSFTQTVPLGMASIREGSFPDAKEGWLISDGSGGTSVLIHTSTGGAEWADVPVRPSGTERKAF